MKTSLNEARCAEHVGRLRAHVEAALGTLVAEAEPRTLYEPARYVLAGQGKRLRPVLLLLAAEVYGVSTDEALPAALAVEVFHNFTLVHDDIMDHAATRRGRPTVHARWDEATALLCGDFLMALSYDLLARTRAGSLAAMMPVYHRMVVRLCEGQALDKAFETRSRVSVEEYLHMIDGKTGALLEAVLELGALLGGAPAADREALRAAGQHLGRAFQIQDDLLDLVAEDDRWGKQVGGDLVEGKKTFLLLTALERAEGEEAAWFARVVEAGGLPEAEVEEARHRMDRLGVLQAAREAVRAYTAAAGRCLERLPDTPARETLCWLFRRMQARLH
ncbi:polyprenyl synthetase family protein [Rhodocaloribacter litoris]|uniref:polyprenyl synthetase family protein n=1 Tax=Rhodocaloribacter litoris TaxID=2558931 RepID=UPI001421771D|nr:polyprenyl synthetase family protein [Rhodocaloribacter litoris]QXD16089.1 polyprenyl synthetase family protein [Rhodocaloribacter litoris]GIV59823.1 MAG: polyprenyl synthetase [Rhodothermaceae bacterium]